MLGVSFNTTVGPIAVSGEVTYRHDAPFATVGSEIGALSNDLDGQTAFRTGAANPNPTSLIAAVSDPSGRFDPANPQASNMVAARTGQLNFLGVIAAEEALLGLAPGTISGTLAPSAAGAPTGTATADAAAAAGQFIALDVQGAVPNVPGPTGLTAFNVLDASPADVAFLPHVNVATPQQTSSVLDPSRVGADRFLSIAEEDVFTAQATFISTLFASNPFVTVMGPPKSSV